MQLYCIFLLCTFFSSWIVITSSAPLFYQGFVGPYHPSNSTIPDGSKRGIWPTFRFGRTAIENSASDGGWLLADDLDYLCNIHDIKVTNGICKKCNNGLKYFGYNIDTLKKSMLYLESNPKK